MILVDTSVWIDLFTARETPQVRRLEEALTGEEDVCTCGMVLAEVLQGIRSDAEHRRVRDRFEAFLYLPASRETYLRAAELYRTLRRRGLTVRKPVDCLIAAVALEHGVPLLHADRDFDPIAAHCGLRVVC